MQTQLFQPFQHCQATAEEGGREGGQGERSRLQGPEHCQRQILVEEQNSVFVTKESDVIEYYKNGIIYLICLAILSIYVKLPHSIKYPYLVYWYTVPQSSV